MGRAGSAVASAKAEATADDIVITIRGLDWLLPAELPASILDPLIDGELDDLIAMLVQMYGDGDEQGELNEGAVIAVIARNPRLLSSTLRALKRTYAELLGEEQWQAWLDTRPSLPDYIRFARQAASHYGVGLGEALGLSSSSTDGGKTSKRTSPPQASTRAASGSQRAIRR